MNTKSVIQSVLTMSLTIFILRQLYFVPTTASFLDSLQSFTFGLLNREKSAVLLLIISLVIPVYVMIGVFYDIYSDSMPFDRFVTDILLRHFVFGYLTISVIYSIDIIDDFLFSAEYESLSAKYNPYHKYIFHLVFAPIMFVDAIYSMEIETIKSKNSSNPDEKRKKNEKIHLAMQILMICYVVYGALIILHLDGQFDVDDGRLVFKILKIKDNISESLKELFKYILICLFVPLATGLGSQWSNIGRPNFFRIVYFWFENED